MEDFKNKYEELIVFGNNMKDNLQPPSFKNYSELKFFDTTWMENNTIEKAIKSHLKKDGEKYNKGKLPMSVIKKQFPNAMKAIVKCSQYGHKKYPADVDWMNYSRVAGGSKTYRDACERHSLEEGLDESGLPHIFHELWNKMAEVELWIKENNYETN